MMMMMMMLLLMIRMMVVMMMAELQKTDWIEHMYICPHQKVSTESWQEAFLLIYMVHWIIMDFDGSLKATDGNTFGN